MRYSDSTLGSILKPISRRWFDRLVEREDANAYDKTFDSWSHLVALVYAQLSGLCSLRGLTASWNANAHHHYHLGVSRLARSTLSDANERRPPSIFQETFSQLSGLADRLVRREGGEMVRLIDATPVPLGRVVDWAKRNGRIRGLKMHVVYDPAADNPTFVDITHANVNDIEIGRTVPLEAGCSYVFDKAYCRYDWWVSIDQADACFVTRMKTSARFRAQRWRAVAAAHGDGFTILDDAEVKMVSKGDSTLAIPCDASASSATAAARSSCSPTTSLVPPSRSPTSTRRAGRSSCCSDGSSSTSRSDPSLAKTKTPSVSSSWPQ